ncbi:hypothetical protein CSIV_04910 [Microbacterium sp. CSI-V]|uniref:hypothetical protein n=1 Tax=Microbacterium sp. CSI-V TaxID=1933777 RepID=UPI00097C2076|nr:hypothetical protein [Microbacterium sp. CSI-V]ONI65622.1 hypothetical protein CSIV_04910 [Microbacterium sp. CSI-V]
MVVTRFYVFETRGGALLEEIEPSEQDWQEQSNTAETINAHFVDGVRGWRNLFTPWKHSIAVDVGGHLLGGPIIPQDFDRDESKLKVTARGFRHMLNLVPVLPPPPGLLSAAAPDWLAPDGKPAEGFDTIIDGVDHGTIGKRLVQQGCLWPGWADIPIRFHADRPGTRQQSYTAVERKKIGAALTDLSNQENGPDIRIRLERTSSDSFGWVYESGTEEQPRLQGEAPLTWEPNDVTGVGVQLDPTRMGSVSWASAGRSSDTTLLRMQYDPYLIDNGFPLLHLDADVSTTTKDAVTLDSANVETLRTARKPWEFWSFDASGDQSPFPYEYGCGDLAELFLSEQQQIKLGLLTGPGTLTGPGVVTGDTRLDPIYDYLPAGSYRRRIVGLSGSSRSDFIEVTCGATYDEEA